MVFRAAYFLDLGILYTIFWPVIFTIPSLTNFSIKSFVAFLVTVPPTMDGMWFSSDLGAVGRLLGYARRYASNFFSAPAALSD